MATRVCVIGLDCAPPELVLDRWVGDLPNLRRLMASGLYGPLASTIPPITVPAWMSMFTGKDPGTLGIYGFRNRADHSYDKLGFASSRMVREEAVWDVIARHGKRSILVGVPLTYPPKPINGLLVGDFLSPSTDADYTFPASLKDEIREAVGDYIIDVRDFRTHDKERLLGEIRAMADRRFELVKHLATKHEWDLLVAVEMGPDRIQHGFWRYMDPEHPAYDPASPFVNAIHDHYVQLDAHIGDLLALLPPDTAVLVVSDHGAKRMDGGICLNEWLIQQGWLTLKEAPSGVTRFGPDLVDWSRTRAWGDGGYYGRIFLNVEGREPQGVIPQGDYEDARTWLVEQLQALGDEGGAPIGTRVYRPEEVYQAVNGVAPDLIAYFGDLCWRSVGSVGHGSVWTRENDTGPDDANHAQQGIAILTGLGGPAGVLTEEMSIYDIAPTILGAFGIDTPAGMGRRSVSATENPSVYTEDEEAEIARRLSDLGYL